MPSIYPAFALIMHDEDVTCDFIHSCKIAFSNNLAPSRISLYLVGLGGIYPGTDRLRDLKISGFLGYLDVHKLPQNFKMAALRDLTLKGCKFHLLRQIGIPFNTADDVDM